jgi:hypothetical protein
MGPAMADRYPFAGSWVLFVAVGVIHYRRNIQMMWSCDQLFTVNPSIVFLRIISLIFQRLSLD